MAAKLCWQQRQKTSGNQMATAITEVLLPGAPIIIGAPGSSGKLLVVAIWLPNCVATTMRVTKSDKLSPQSGQGVNPWSGFSSFRGPGFGESVVWVLANPWSGFWRIRGLAFGQSVVWPLVAWWLQRTPRRSPTERRSDQRTARPHATGAPKRFRQDRPRATGTQRRLGRPVHGGATTI